MQCQAVATSCLQQQTVAAALEFSKLRVAQQVDGGAITGRVTAWWAKVLGPVHVPIHGQVLGRSSRSRRHL